MSEKLKPLTSKELLNPRTTPELGFQSYEMLGGEAEVRELQKANFLEGSKTNPSLDYPMLDEQTLNEGIARLEGILTHADTLDEPERSAIWDSAAYRMAEMYWLKSLIRLNIAYQDGRDVLDVVAFAEESQQLNVELYGQPDKLVHEQIVNEVYQQIHDKELSEEALMLLGELTHGFVVDTKEQSIAIRPIAIKAGPELPRISAETLDMLADKIEEQFSDILSVVDSYYEEVIMQRPESERTFTPDDIYTIFVNAHEVRDPNNESGVKVIFDKNATALSWDTPRMAVVVGGRRSPISSVIEMKAKLVHEYGIHGGRAIHGIDTSLPILGTGVYTDADPGENSDYLTFEEGLATICEKALVKKSEKWLPVDLEKTLGIGLAYEGRSFREVFEVLWRIRVLLVLKDGEVPTESVIEKAKKNSYSSCERIFRGTPTSMSRIAPSGQEIVSTYNKDLAYLMGKIKAMEFLATCTDEELDLSFKAKIDPTNHRQLELARDTIIVN